MTSTPNNESAAITRAAEVIAEAAARRYCAGQSYRTAIDGAVADFSARWPRLGAFAAEALAGVTL